MNPFTRLFDWYTSTKSVRSAGRLPLPQASASMRSWGTIADASTLIGINLSNSRIDYAREVGDVMQNSIVAACLNWICTSWQDTKLEVQRKTAGNWAADENHPANDLFDDPNPDYDYERLSWALLIDYWTHGRAYVHVITVGGIPVELEWMPAYCTERKGDQYIYRPNNKDIPVPMSEVVPIRFGISPMNLLEGRPPLEAGLREIFADNEATVAHGVTLRNRGVPSAIVGPDGSGPNGQPVTVNQTDAQLIKDQYQLNSTGDNRGKIIVFPTSFKYQAMEFDPAKMDYGNAHNTPEERICALFQIPPGVVGMGAGLDRNTYSNAEEANRWAWENNLIPTGNYFAKCLTRGILARYPGYRSRTQRFAYNRDEVRVLQEDMSSKRADALAALDGGAITIEEARSEMGYETDDEVLAKLAEQRASAVPVPKPTEPGVPVGADA